MLHGTSPVCHVRRVSCGRDTAGKLALCVSLCLLAACGSREILIPKSGEVPVGVDFSGTWQIRNDARAEQRKINDAIRKTDGVNDRIIVRRADVYDDRNRIISTRRNRGGLVHVFLENGSVLKITQTPGGLFLSFDRAVVEEFRFGENREVRVGPVIADRVSGWEGRTYVSETLDQNGMKLTERLRLSDLDTLQRTIILRSKNEEEETIVQTFDRIR